MVALHPRCWLFLTLSPWQEKDLSRAEALFVDAKKPELALRAYMEVKRYPEALRVAKAHLPHRIKEVNAEIQRRVNGEASTKEVRGG